MSYRLLIHPKAEKDIGKIHAVLVKQIIKKIFALQDNPRPHGFKKLVNFESERMPGQECYRIRVGDVRVIYTIQDEIITVTVVQVKKRGDIY